MGVGLSHNIEWWVVGGGWFGFCRLMCLFGCPEKCENIFV
jgi:hypothetical protein